MWEYCIYPHFYFLCEFKFFCNIFDEFVQVESVSDGWTASKRQADEGEIIMQEKFMNLSKPMQWLVVIVAWLITIVGFAGCLVVKHYNSIMWLELLLTCLGMFFCIVAICLTIILIVGKEEKDPDIKL